MLKILKNNQMIPFYVLHHINKYVLRQFKLWNLHIGTDRKI
jgi:hypothetical protein